MQFVTYRRVSTKEQGKSGLGLEAQAQAIETFIQQGGHEALADFSDVLSGGLAPLDRPGLTAALAMVRRVKGSALLVSKLDRLSRSVEVIARLMNDTRCPFYTVEDGLDVPPVMLHMKAGFAEHERRSIGQRTSAALQVRKAQGKALGCHAHADPQTIIRARAAGHATRAGQADAWACRMAPALQRMRDAGMTNEAIATELTALGTPTVKGGPWTRRIVEKTLMRVAGLQFQAGPLG